MTFDFLVIGGGIVGISTAWQLQQRYPDLRILLLEKEPKLTTHQSGRNSGVIHSGLYYPPGSLKATLCREGNGATLAFCRDHGLRHERRGKLLVATNALEADRMQRLRERARANNVETSVLGIEALKELEPRVLGLGALLVPATGIVDFREIASKMGTLFESLGGEIRLETEVQGLDERGDEVHVDTSVGAFEARYVICCAGVMADRLVRMSGIDADFRIIPFRGDYYQLAPEKASWFRHLIYPIPDPELPFLGVHITPLIDGRTTLGPSAVPALKREGYGKMDVSWRDFREMATYPGFWHTLRRNLRPALRELSLSLSKKVYLSSVQRYCPGLTIADLHPHPSGVRAQAVRRDGSFVDDFLFAKTRRTVHVCNAPSPAATSAIPIGRRIVDEVQSLRD